MQNGFPKHRIIQRRSVKLRNDHVYEYYDGLKAKERAASEPRHTVARQRRAESREAPEAQRAAEVHKVQDA